MKIKSLIFTALVFGALATTSCSKEKDCECTTTVTGADPVTATQHITEGDCDDLNSTVTFGTTETKVVCKEK